MKPILIGLYSATSRSGKSTAAGMMVDQLFASIFSFAEPIKDMVVEAVYPFFDYDKPAVRAMLNDDRKDTYVIPQLGVTLRQIMQTLGTPWGRESIHPDIWTQIARKKAEKALKSYSVIFDDLRFPNEYALIKEMGGDVIMLTRPNNTGGDSSIGEGLLDSHVFDHTIINDGDLVQLHGRVGALVRDYLAPKPDHETWQ